MSSGEEAAASATPTSGPAAGPDELLDCRGQRCPLPVIELARLIGQVPVGAVVRVLADDPAAVGDIPAWCRMRDQQFLGIHIIDAVAAFDVRRLR